jgi:hypothetical protein
MDLALLLVYWEQPGDGLRHRVNVARGLTTAGLGDATSALLSLGLAVADHPGLAGLTA